MKTYSPEARARVAAYDRNAPARWYGTRHEATPPVRNHNDEYAEYFGVFREPYETDASLDRRVLEARGRLIDTVRPVRRSLWQRIGEWLERKS